MVLTSDGNVEIPCKEFNCDCGYSDCIKGMYFTCPSCGSKYMNTSDGFVKIGGK